MNNSNEFLHSLLSEEDLLLQPLSVAETIPSQWYYHRDILQFEQDYLFRRTWHYVGSADQCKEVGSFFTTEIADNPIVIVRGNDEVLRGFFNVCRHRAGPLCTQSHGVNPMLQCQYHGWTYTLEGMLRGVPHFQHVELFDKKDFGLIPVQLKVWNSLVFVSCAPESEQSLHEFDELIQGIEERIAPTSLQTMKFAERVIYIEDCNWKVYIDNYLEGYHIPLVHPELNKILDYRNYVTEVHPLSVLQTSSLVGDNIYSLGDDSKAWYYWIFPTMMLNILPDRLQVNSVRPLNPTQCEVIFDYYYTDIHSEQAQEQCRIDKAYSDMVQQEDSEICRHVQKGLQSQAYSKGRYSVRFEHGVYHFHSLLRQAFSRVRNT